MRRRINTIFRSRALRAALLAELYGGQDAALVVQMVEQVRSIVRPSPQAVAPMPQQNEDEVAPEVQARPVDPPTQAEAPPQRQVRPVEPPTQAEAPPQRQVRPVEPPTQAEAPPQVQVTPSDGHTAATAVEISDSESELSSSSD